MEYYFDELDPVRFQRLIHALLQHEFGDALLTGPLRGADGGLDAEAFVSETAAVRGRMVRPGRHLFQIKYHRMTDADSTRLRRRVLNEYIEEAPKDVATRGDGQPTFFHLITNVSSSVVARQILDGDPNGELVPGIEGRIWWQSDVVALLDRTPSVWPAFPELFAGRAMPLVGGLTSPAAEGPAATLRAAIAYRYEIDRHVKFRQIELEKELARLFIDPELLVGGDARHEAINFLFAESSTRLLVEGGPGQGKSTMTQMLAQIYRHEILGKHDIQPESRFCWPEKLRVPLRVELRRFADANSSLEQYRQIRSQATPAGGPSP